MSVDTYSELTTEENRDLGALDKLLLSNQRKRALASAQLEKSESVARSIAAPEVVARENAEREAKKAELRDLPADLEAEGSDED